MTQIPLNMDDDFPKKIFPFKVLAVVRSEIINQGVKKLSFLCELYDDDASHKQTKKLLQPSYIVARDKKRENALT